MAEDQPKIHLKNLAHAHYVHADYDKANEFLNDFGFVAVSATEDKTYYRGYGEQPFVYCACRGDESAFGGAAWTVDSVEDLELAAKTLPHATPVHDLDSPGGGKRVSFQDPVDGFAFHLIHGQQLRADATLPPSAKELTYNFPHKKSRAVNETQRFDKGPALVHKLGHFGLCVTNFAKMYDFFTAHFNLVPSEMVHAPGGDGRTVTTFMHLDRGSEWVDHHVFFFFEGPKPHVHHTSFEVHDFDVQQLGHHWLQKQGYDLAWGVGRHVMGSQIFDYWYDTSRFIVEHYADGDLVNDQTPVSHSDASLDNLFVWGPDVPATFMS